MDTTNISDLPTNNTLNNENITMTQTERMVNQPEVNSIQTQENNVANINSVLERARENGSLSLPSRDIPMDQTTITNDNEAHPDFIPNKDDKDYVKEMMTIEELQEKRRKERNKEDSLEEIYEQLQTPIFIGILFFIFQLPITNKYFHKYFSIGFRSDGQMNLQGYLGKSLLFAFIYYSLNLLMHKLNDI